MIPQSLAENIRFVLVEPSHPGNIGATARAMKAMGLSRLALVRPARFPSAEATARAAGADELLHRAQVVEGLEEALTGCTLVLGTSARRRSIEWPELDPASCARKVVDRAAVAQVALVFGRESSGLSNHELDRCQYLVRIPTNPNFASLNLAAAVQLTAYEILRLFSSADQRGATAGVAQESVGVQELEGFYRHLETTLVDLDFVRPNGTEKLMRRLRRLFNRAGPDATELNILRGILSAAQRAKDDRARS